MECFVFLMGAHAETSVFYQSRRKYSLFISSCYGNISGVESIFCKESMGKTGKLRSECCAGMVCGEMEEMMGMLVLNGGALLGGLCCAETPSRASQGLTVACRADVPGCAAVDGQANDAWLSQTVVATQTARPDSFSCWRSKM
jgi:hypothetical protein